MRIPMLAASAFSLLTLGAIAPASAQDQPGDKVNVVIVYGDDACPVSTGDEITVCARQDEADRYRIPEPLRSDPSDPANQSWTERVRAFEYVGETGINSCSPVGAGGFTGCTQELIREAYAERAQSSGVQAGRLVEEARQERLARIDEEAAAVQSRVEEVEAELAEREAERAAAATAGQNEAGETDETDLETPPSP